MSKCGYVVSLGLKYLIPLLGIFFPHRTVSDGTHATCAFCRGNFSLIKIIPIVVSIRRVRLLWSVTRAIWSTLVLFSTRVYPSCSNPNFVPQNNGF